MSFKSFESSSDKYSSQQEEKFSEEESKKYYSSEYEDKFKEYDQKDLFESLQEPVELKPLDLNDLNTKIEVQLTEAVEGARFKRAKSLYDRAMSISVLHRASGPRACIVLELFTPLVHAPR